MTIKQVKLTFVVTMDSDEFLGAQSVFLERAKPESVKKDVLDILVEEYGFSINDISAEEVTEAKK